MRKKSSIVFLGNLCLLLVVFVHPVWAETSPEFSYFFAKTSVDLLDKKLWPGESLGNPARGSLEFKGYYQSVLTNDPNAVRENLRSKLKTMVEITSGRMPKGHIDWYSTVAAEWAKLEISFGGGDENSKDENVYRKTAKGFSKDDVFNRLSFRLDRVFQYPRLGALVKYPIPIKDTATALKIVGKGFIYNTVNNYSRYAVAAEYPGLRNMLRALERLPRKFNNVFKAGGKVTTLELNNETKWAWWGWRNVSARAFGKLIALRDDGVDERSFYHELGHEIHWNGIQGDFPPLTAFKDELNDLLKNNLGQSGVGGKREPGYVTWYASSNLLDEFAESFMEYSFNRVGFKNLADQDSANGNDRLKKMYNFMERFYKEN